VIAWPLDRATLRAARANARDPYVVNRVGQFRPRFFGWMVDSVIGTGRDQKFESASLRRRVCELFGPGAAGDRYKVRLDARSVSYFTRSKRSIELFYRIWKMVRPFASSVEHQRTDNFNLVNPTHQDWLLPGLVFPAAPPVH